MTKLKETLRAIENGDREALRRLFTAGELEDDLLKEGYREPVSELMRESLRATMEGDKEALESIWLDQVAPNGNFCPDDKGISWMFQPYDIAPYALGAISVDVSWEKLKPYLK